MQLLLGGLITLAVTAVVQILVIPRVQRRTRALERWEDNVVELAGVVHEEWTDRLSAFTRTLQVRRGIGERFAEMIKDDPSIAEAARGGTAKASKEARQAFLELYELTSKMTTLQRRCTQVNTRSTYWLELLVHIARTTELLHDLGPLLESPGNDAQEDEQLALIRGSHQQVVQLVDGLTQTFKPPKKRATRRQRRKLLNVIARIWVHPAQQVPGPKPSDPDQERSPRP